MLKLSENPPITAPHVQSLLDFAGHWWVGHTRARFEKAFAWELLHREIGYFLPLVQRVRVSGGRKRRMMMPLFPGYVFFCGSELARYEAMCTGRLCQAIDVVDQARLVHELHALETALTNGAELEVYRGPAIGQRCRVTAGPFEGVPEPQTVKRMADRIKPMGWHLVVHLDAEDIVELSPLLLSLPMPFVIDHMGRVKADQGLDQPAFKKLLDLMKHENTWVKVTGPERVSSGGPPFTDAIPFAQAVIAAAPDRVLWGTDFPHPNVKHMPNDGHLVDLLGMMAPDPAVLNRLLVDNPTKLYWSN